MMPLLTLVRDDLAPAARMGVRAAAGVGARGALRVVLMGAAAAVGCFLVLAGLALPGVVDAQQARRSARAIVDTASGETPTIADSSGGLRMAAIEDAVDGRPLLRVATAGVTADAARPPGVDALPLPGEMVASPALAQLIVVEPAVRSRFPQKIVGAIGEDGLVAPDELMAYVGVEDAALAGRPPIAGFGRPHSTLRWAGATATEQFLNPQRVVGYAFAFFMLAPLAVLVTVCSRLASRVREQRLAALRLIGLTRAQVQVWNSIEVGIAAFTGSVLGLVAFAAVAPRVHGLHVGRFSWFATDVATRPLHAILVPLAFTLFSVAVAALSSLPVLRRPLSVRRMAPAANPSWLRFVPLAVGLACVLASSRLQQPSAAVLITFGAGLLALAVGLPLALSSVMRGIGWLLGRFASALPTWLFFAARRWQHAPHTAPRLAAGIVTTVFVVGVAMFSAPLTSPWGNRAGAADGQPVRVHLHDVADASAVQATLSPLGVKVTLYDREMWRSADGLTAVPVVVAACPEAQTLLDVTVPDCRDGGSYRIDNRDPAWRDTGVAAESVWEAPDGQQWVAPDRSLSVTSADPAVVDAALLIIDARRVAHGVVLVVPADRHDSALGALAAAFPGKQILYPRVVQRGFDVEAALTLLAFGGVLALFIGFTAFAVASVDHLIDAGRRNAALLAIGLPRRLLGTVECCGVLGTVVVGVAAAASALVLVVAVGRDVAGATAATPVLPPWTLVTVGAGAMAVMALVMLLASSVGRSTAENIRRE